MQPDETRILDLTRHGRPVHRGGRGFFLRDRADRDPGRCGRRPRCWWCGDDPLYVAYHDLEWGAPLRDERPCSSCSASRASRPGSPGSRSSASGTAFRAGVRGLRPRRPSPAFHGPRRRAAARRRGHRPPPRARSTGHHRPTPGPCTWLMAAEGTSLDEVVWSHAPVARARPLRKRSEIRRDPRSRPGWQGACARRHAVRGTDHGLRVHAVGRARGRFTLAGLPSSRLRAGSMTGRTQVVGPERDASPLILSG
jgi:hypothetical protein